MNSNRRETRQTVHGKETDKVQNYQTPDPKSTENRSDL